MSESETREKKRPVKLEDAAQETGELIGKGIKKTWNVMKSFGKGVVDTLEKEEERRHPANSACPHCGASNPVKSRFCAACGKRI